jgi:hypothetical protein
MRIRAPFVMIFLLMLCVAGRAELVVLQDPDKWIESAMQDITRGNTDEFARSYLKLINKPESFDAFAGNLSVLKRLTPLIFMERVSDVKFGTALREVIYVALYKEFDYMYFRFTIKKNRDGWVISNFQFKSEPGELFPAGFQH